MNSSKTTNTEKIIVALYFGLYIGIALALVFFQPFGNPPDEYFRYLIPEYILNHNALPNGYEECIRIENYGFSYAFQPILPYIIQSFAMRFMGLFSSETEMLVLSARLINVLFGLIMAYYVLLLSRKWFQDKRMQYIFAYLIMFLPENLFMHTYINTDSCCLMAIAIMLYGITLGIEKHFNFASCITLSAGIIFCALSYYNAYGFILSSILLFIANFITLSGRKPRLDWKSFLQKGVFISAIVLIGISWWFIRSYTLYDGDILGLRARENCAILYASPNANPLTRVTYETQGFTVFEMLRDSNFISSTIYSFICVMGSMSIVSSPWIYRFFKLLLFGGLFCCIFIPAKPLGITKNLFSDRRAFRIFFHCNMIFCILMPCLLSISYSYNTDYQPQGRYILPALIPLAYYTVRGVEKAWALLCLLLKKYIQKKPVNDVVLERIYTGLSAATVVCLALCMLVTLFGYVLPYYNVY